MKERSHCEAPAYAAGVAIEKRPARILIVDDNADAITLLETFLQRRGFEVSSASDAESAFTQILAGPPDLLITDHRMPNTSGLELCHQIRSDNRIHQFPIIMHTASAVDPSCPAVYEQLVPKPVDLYELLGAVDDLLLAHSNHSIDDQGRGIATRCSAPAPDRSGGPKSAGSWQIAGVR